MFGPCAGGKRLFIEEITGPVGRGRPDPSAPVDGHRLVVNASFEAGEMAAVRRQIAAAVGQTGLAGAAAEGLIIAANEMMTNAVRHGGGCGVLRLWVAADVVCEVTDQGAGFAAAAYQDRSERAPATPSGGMGLWIAQQTTDSLKIDSGPAGTTVRVVVIRRAERGSDVSSPPDDP
jgi:anti-sigma regulatory factor (Ser/Thr protein kinase)